MAAKAVSQGEIIRRNIAAISAVQQREDDRRSLTDRTADAVTHFSGSMRFVYLHVVWFGLWVLLNVGVITLPFLGQFDEFPFGLLTMIVSLEAIFLSTFVLISQNRMARLSEKRAELDLHVNMLAEQKAAKTLELLDDIARQLDQMSRRFNFTPDPEVAALKISPEPHEVLQVIEEAAADAADVGRKLDDISGEFEQMKGEVREVDEKVEQVGDEVREVKSKLGAVEEVRAKLREITGEHYAPDGRDDAARSRAGEVRTPARDEEEVLSLK